MMRGILTAVLTVAAGTSAGQAAAQQPLAAENFQARTTGDLLTLCAPAPNDPLAVQAIHFCHGYLVGAFAYYSASVAGRDDAKRVCLPQPPPSRDAGVAHFVSWARANPQYLQERPVETEFRFLETTWPCRR